MDLQDQLKQLFPNHKSTHTEEKNKKTNAFWLQDEPLICKYEKRNGKPTTIIEGYNGAKKDFKQLSRQLKTALHVGGSIKNDTIIIQGNYRDKIMAILKDIGFTVKRVGG